MTKEEFLKKVGEVESHLIAFWCDGGFPLCIEIDSTISSDARDNFHNKMKANYWPNESFISFQVNSLFPSFEEREEFTAFFRLVCLHEWKERVLKTKAYKGF